MSILDEKNYFIVPKIVLIYSHTLQKVSNAKSLTNEKQNLFHFTLKESVKVDKNCLKVALFWEILSHCVVIKHYY